MFVTWKLNFIDGYGYSPEVVIVERGGTAQPLVAEASIESGGKILAKVSGDVSGLEIFEVQEVSPVEAEAFVRANFVESDDYKIEQALSLLN